MKKDCFDNHEESSRDSTSTLCARAKRKSSAIGALNELWVIVELDELSDNFLDRKWELYKLIQSTYDRLKREFEESHDDVVRNGEYTRKFKIVDPVEEIDIVIEIVVQRYLSKSTGVTRTFYGGLFMPYLPYLLCQLLYMVTERLAEESSRSSKESDEWHFYSGKARSDNPIFVMEG